MCTVRGEGGGGQSLPTLCYKHQLKNVNSECMLANCDECYDEKEPGAVRDSNEEPDLEWGQAQLPRGSDI